MRTPTGNPKQRSIKRLTYWVCASRGGKPAYNIRTKTRREAKRLREDHAAGEYDPPVKVVLEYRDAFHLLWELRSECCLLAPEPKCSEEGAVGTE